MDRALLKGAIERAFDLGHACGLRHSARLFRFMADDQAHSVGRDTLRAAAEALEEHATKISQEAQADVAKLAAAKAQAAAYKGPEHVWERSQPADHV